MSSPRTDAAEIEVDAAARALANAQLVIFPTETVYGVGVSLRQAAVAAEIYRLKDRPHTMPLMLHVLGDEAIEAFTVDAPAFVRTLAEAFWPGPLTLIAPAAEGVSATVLGGGTTVALRAPDHPQTRALLRALGELEEAVPAIAGTSANRHGAPAPVDLASARQAFGASGPPVLDGGRCTVGVASTVLRVLPEGLEILREGVVDVAAIEAACGCRPTFARPAR